ncbi:hypothetical protein BHQ18_09445 [Mycolicibacterium flavescens]|uniref:Uncharacterized protein n=1 Tax=Mycolicibacterium flavescens TaxID=1776 RepID=A0A1E3RM25_MYCFV|nr:hypothetical protein BHQ18_09445 [Mycolicibacterium flavescens]
MELLQHRARNDNEDPLAANAADQLRQQDSDLQGLAQSECVADQDARSEIQQGLRRRTESVVHTTEQPAMAHSDPTFACWTGATATDRFQPESRASKAGRVIRDQIAVSRVEAVGGVERAEEHCVLITDQGADTGHLDAHPVSLRVPNGADEPLFVADDEALAGGYFRHPIPIPVFMRQRRSRRTR